MEVFITVFTCLFCYFLGMTFGYKIGFLYGKITYIDFSPKEVVNTTPKKYNTQEPEIKKSIEIDEKKIVVDITTAGMEKKYDNLGKLTTANEDISNSVNKLKNLRKD